MNALPHAFVRRIELPAPPAAVFRWFADPTRFARWWGEGSTIEARVGGELRIVHPNRVVVHGEVLAVDPDASITFSYGYEDPAKPVAPGGSQVQVHVTEHECGSRLELTHRFADEATRDLHAAGWRYHLAVLANAVADDHLTAREATVDEWFAAWHEADAELRGDLLRACTTQDVTFRDRYACVAGRDDLQAHIAACLVHMPGTIMRRVGEVRHCQGTAVVDWHAADAQGAPRGKGTNVFRLGPDGRVREAVGFW